MRSRQPAVASGRARLTYVSVAELAGPFDISQPAVSKHLRVLERAGLVSVGQDRQYRPRRLETKPLVEAHAWIERYRAAWESSFGRLDALLEELKPARGARVRRRKARHDTGERR